MLVIILSQQLIDIYFRDEVTEFTVGRLVATCVYLIVGALVLTFVEIKTKKGKKFQIFKYIGCYNRMRYPEKHRKACYLTKTNDEKNIISCITD